MQIDPGSHVPIYLQIADAVRSAVASAVYRPGEALPSLRLMAIELKVNPNTVQRAYDELEREGLVYSQRGKGLFVAEQGLASAQSHALNVIRRAFEKGVRAGRGAGISPDEIRRVFEAAFDGANNTQEPTVMSTSSCDGPAIALAGLTKIFGRTMAVASLSLEIPRGSTFGLLGPNGAGKSTTIKMLMGMLSITTGEAHVLGIDVAKNATAVKQRVGYVPETHQIYRWMRVGEVIGFCRALYTTWNDQTCREMLELFRLDLNKKVKHLSKGMLVKLALLLAVSHDPELLLLDEPIAGLDPLAREEFLDGVLRTICERGQTVLFSSHTIDDVQRLADTVGILYEGRMLAYGRIDEMLTTTKRIRATLRDGQRPAGRPSGTVHDHLNGREWLVTVRDFRPELAQQVRALEGVEHVEVLDLGLEELFKDIVKGQRAAT